jgi:hypothetical protein
VEKAKAAGDDVIMVALEDAGRFELIAWNVVARLTLATGGISVWNIESAREFACHEGTNAALGFIRRRTRLRIIIEFPATRTGSWSNCTKCPHVPACIKKS